MSGEREGAGPEGPARGASAPAASARARRPKRVWRRRVFALLLGTLAPLLLVEAGVRVLWERLVWNSERGLLEAESVSLGRALRLETLNNPGFDLRQSDRSSPLYRFDERRGFSHKPGVTVVKELPNVPPAGLRFTVRTDEHGCRGLAPERASEGAEPLVVLALGDSMTFGEGVEDGEAWPAQLEALLREAYAPRTVRVYNAGVVSYGQQEQLATLRELAPRLRPDVVLCQFTVANDPVDDLRWIDADGPLRVAFGAAETLEHHILLDNPFARWSRAYRLVIWRWGRHAIKYRFMMEEPVLDRAATLLERIGKVARELLGDEVRYGVVVAPTVVQVKGSPAEWVLGTERLNTGVIRRLEASAVPVCHPIEELREHAAAGEQVYIEVDRHWTAAGHRTVAEAAAPFVRELLEPDAARR